MELLIKNGRLLDGTGADWFRADVAISEGKIVEVGRVSGFHADKEIDATGKIVSPGFIDMHSHSDMTALLYPEAESKVKQGVTTEVVGNCGFTLAPVADDTLELLKRSTDTVTPVSAALTWDWKSLSDYFERVGRLGHSVNYAPLVGQGTIRLSVMGFEKREPSDSEIRKMGSLLRDEIRDGAFGMSSGLVYTPGCFSKTEELVEVAKSMSAEGGLYFSHIRNESSGVLGAVGEAIRIGEEANVPVEVSHVKVMGKSNWGLSSKIISLLEEGRQKGVEVNADMYPYTAGETALWAALPAWAQEGGVDASLARLKETTFRERVKSEMISPREGTQSFVADAGWEGIQIPSVGSGDKAVQGRTMAELAARDGMEPFDRFVKMLLDEKGEAAMIVHSMGEADVSTFMANPLVSIGSDQNGVTPGRGPLGGLLHPRAYGCFPRVLGRYVRENQILGLPEAIRKMTSLPAGKLRLKNRGLVMPGYWADIVVFDPMTIQDRATFENPTLFPEGIDCVIVNGTPVVEKGVHTGSRPGKVLRRNLW